MLAFPDPPATLGNERVALRLAAERDIPEILIAHQDDATLAARLGSERPPSGAELGRRAEASAARRAAGEELWLTVLARDREPVSDDCCGQIEVVDVDPEHERAALTSWIAPGARGRGLGAAALALAGRWLLTDAGLARVHILADPGDPAIRRAAETAGFRSEGVLRGYALRSGGRADVEVLALVVADL
jgi:RimJ/RimL family protein N-acetyltransferase